MRHYATYFDTNYMAQGVALHDSMQRHCQPYHLHILALDEGVEQVGRTLDNVTVVPLQDFLTDELRAATAERTHRETIWTYTPGWMLYVLGVEPAAPSVNYIDADCFFFDNPQPVFNEIGESPIAITPHRFPLRAKHFEVNGLYNVGLVHIKRAGLACLREWERLCLEWCCEQSDGKRFADQKYWDDLVPKYGVHVIEHLGANLAPWNQEQYSYHTRDGKLLVTSEYLLWYHFHQGLDPKWPINEYVKDYCYCRYETALHDAYLRAKETMWGYGVSP